MKILPAGLAASLLAALAGVCWGAVSPPVTDAEHYAIGEVKVGSGWVSLDGLFKDYQQSQADLKTFAPKIDDAQRRAADLQRQASTVKNAAADAERPVKTDLAKQNTRLREIQKALDAPPPKLVLLPVPKAPTSSGSSSGYTSTAAQALQAEIQRVNSANTAARTKYQEDMKTYQDAQTTARKDFPTVKTAVKNDQDQIDKMESDLQGQLAPITAKQPAANAELADLVRQKDTMEGRQKILADALRAAPETLRFKHGILEWQGTFSPMADLEKRLADTQAQVDQIRDQMKAEAAAAGRPFPTDWRHPEQDTLDALKTLVARAAAAREKE
jgi:hypothetical protein